MKQKQTAAPDTAQTAHSAEDMAAGSYYTMLIRRLRDGTFGEILDDWKWILGYTARYKGAVAFFILAGILSTSLGLVGSIASKYLIDIITGYQTDKLALLAVLTIGSALASLLFSSLVERISVKLTLDINNDIQADIFDKIMDADWLSVNRFRSGDILNRFSADIRTVAGNAVGWLPKLIVALYRFTAIFCVLLFYDPPMAFLALGSAPILLLVSKTLIRRQRMHNQKVKAMNSRLTAFEVETFYNFDTVKSFGIAPHYSGKLRELQNEHRGLSLDYQMFSLKTNILMTLVGMVIRYAAFGYCLWQLWTHTITYGTMTLFLQQHGSLSDAFSAVIGVIPVFLNSSVSAHRIRELTELPREQHMPETADGRSLPDLTGGVTVTLHNVDFSYEENRSVLSSSSLTAVPGEIIALVGASGEGKTTLVRLILGLVHPQNGIAVLKNAAGEEIPLNADIRYLFSYVPQGNTILSGTVADNLRMVKEDASPEEMESALRTACAWEFVSALPKGMDTDLGERGRGLSEGQSQRIAIARAVLRDAPILLLDEATSALDVATERKVLKNLMDGRTDRTCIVTTHRPSVLSLCKRVYRVMDTRVETLDEETSARMAMEF